ncbi:uncharacterized protein CXQ87_005108 [Candidozyma duobushaemuli]|uniref:NmrA-like domain-containing protein n=2 Tax=Candidozyma TaxID=3303203 RepID=A0ABX8IAM3_9ASCO|nr:uncharacterized protein CXQ87_005108 [[Candida] duobushaemulonis]PVH14832.1 hypothetical protein CXQ87_005108 [[Candida] duobushaemulonis]QWU90082.1 hypothetical protein CA3LBN_004440 [[Candida] haemuloni]
MSRIAVFGLGGFLGAPVLEALESSSFSDKINYPVLAVTRDDSKYKSTDKVKYVKGDTAKDVDALTKELSGVDVIISLVSPSPDLNAAIEKIAAAVKPKLVIPSQFGVDIEESQQVFPGFLGIKQDHSKKLRDAGLKVVDIQTGLFGTADSFVEHIAPLVGANAETKQVKYLGSPKFEFSYSILSDIGKAVAAVATSNPSSLPDQLRIQSGTISQEAIVAKYGKSKSIEFSATEVSKEDALAEAKKVWAEGFDGSKFLYYLQAIISQGEEKGLWFTKDDNEVVNPKGASWKWTTI